MNVADLVAAAASDGPTRPAFVSEQRATVTWGEVEARVARAAGVLQGQGVRPGDPVAVSFPNSVEFAVAYWGALRAGACVVPVNPGYTVPEVAHLLADSGARVAVVHPTLGTTFTDAGDEVRMVDLTDDAGKPVESAPASEGGHAVICYTSGTTGRPKGAQLSHENFLANVEAFSSLPLLRFHDEDRLLGLLPFFHIFGLNVILNAAARHGASVLVMDRFSPGGSLTEMHRAGVTIAYGAPPVYAAWNAVPPPTRPVLGSLRAAISGADALPVSVWQGFADGYGVEILEGYGLTEAAPVLTSSAASPAVRPGTVGHPLPGVEVRTIGPDGAALPADQAGEVIARGPNVFAGYHRQPEASAEALRDGWLHTGDLGSIADDGYLTLAGRLKDMIIVSGFNVYPREVEQALLEHPAVADAAVVGAPDSRTGERVRALVVPAPGATPERDDLLAHCRARLARYKLPRDIQVVEALPRLPSGKLQRSALREG